MANDELSQVLVMVLGIMIFIFFVLLAIFIILKMREKQQNEKVEDIISSNTQGKKGKDKKQPRIVDSSYTKQSILDFMQFDKIEDNMIIQKKGRRYLMVVECQGINYDLMSKAEKIGVEEGFQQFLNTLRHPIQIYIQTRTVNLENSISTYKEKVKEIENDYNQMLFRYNQMRNDQTQSRSEVEKAFYEVTKRKNLLEYGRDILANTEKMSLNKSILNKKYYIIIPYFVEDAGDIKYDYDEIRNMAFSELYTKSQSIIRTLSSCSVNGKILSSQELAELLYVAYNRDESEVFGIKKALQAGYEELYSTAPDVYEKKIKALDEEIEKQAIELANKTIEQVKSKPQQMAEEKETSMDELIRKMAEMVLNDNRQYVGDDVAEAAINKIKETEEEGDNDNEQSKKKTTSNRKRKTSK